MRRVFKQLEEAAGALEREISSLDPDGEDWSLFFRMLHSFRQFHLFSYRETLLLAMIDFILDALDGNPSRLSDYLS